MPDFNTQEMKIAITSLPLVCKPLPDESGKKFVAALEHCACRGKSINFIAAFPGYYIPLNVFKKGKAALEKNGATITSHSLDQISFQTHEGCNVVVKLCGGSEWFEESSAETMTPLRRGNTKRAPRVASGRFNSNKRDPAKSCKKRKLSEREAKEDSKVDNEDSKVDNEDSDSDKYGALTQECAGLL